MTDSVVQGRSSTNLHEYIHSVQGKVLNIYFTAGYPELNDTLQILNTLEKAGADLVEIGIPFSDPLADGPVIQGSNMASLSNGMTTALLLDQLESYNGNLPILLMGYLNPVLQYGLDKFLERCAHLGISGLILPDLPIELYARKYKDIFENHRIANIGLVTPQTASERIHFIDASCSGFIYAVSSSSTTGSQAAFQSPDAYLERLSLMNLRNPVLTGFNIKDRESFTRASQYTAGGIIGSAFIKALGTADHLEESIIQFVKSIKP